MALFPRVPPGNFTIADLFVFGLGLIRAIASFSAMLAVAAILWGGLRIITSGGNEEQVKSGKAIVIYALGGLAVIVLSFVIVGQVLRLIEAKCPFDSQTIQELVKKADTITPANEKQAYLEQLRNTVAANPDCASLLNSIP